MTRSHLRPTFLLSLLLLGVIILTQSIVNRPTPATAAPFTIEYVANSQGLPIETIPSSFEEIHDTPGTTNALLRLINNQEVEVNFTIAILRIGCSDIGGVSWLNVTPTTGTVMPARPRFVSVTFDSRELPQGTYTAVICIFTDSSSIAVEVPVSLYAGGGATVTPTATSPNVPPTATATSVPNQLTPTRTPTMSTGLPTVTRTATGSNQATPTSIPNQLTPTRTPTTSTGLPTVTRTPTTGAPLTHELFLPLVRRR